ncbi:hypothetical protein QC762_0102750 [Podospora pseudocomata]|uniref:Uncharacterized protein n=1 Tax=Podospora pseudocomata TaxID=2093779 RepID=A0ABR0G9H2_9PEZI|nr:hypothetical protein QC762_0102750 [Podospora pseudocomata]
MAPATTNRLALPIWTPGQPGRRRTKLRPSAQSLSAEGLGIKDRTGAVKAWAPITNTPQGTAFDPSRRNVKLSIHLGVKVVVGSSGALHCVLLNKRA